MEVMVAQPCECTKSLWVVNFKMMNFCSSLVRGRLGIQCGHCSSSGRCYGVDSVVWTGKFLILWMWLIVIIIKVRWLISFLSFSPFFFFFVFLGPHLQHMGVPRLGVKLELQPPGYTTSIATQDLSYISDLHHSSQQCLILNPLNEARDWYCILRDASQIRFCWATMGNPKMVNFSSWQSSHNIQVY